MPAIPIDTSAPLMTALRATKRWVRLHKRLLRQLATEARAGDPISAVKLEHMRKISPLQSWRLVSR